MGAVVRVQAERLREAAADLGQPHPVLRPARAGEARLDGAQVEVRDVGEARRLLLLAGAEQALLLGVRLDQLDQLVRAPRLAHVAERPVVHREDGGRRPELRRHVGDGGAVGDGQGAQAGAEELDELADDAAAAQELGDRQHQVGRGDARLQRAGQPDAEHLRRGQVERLAEHRGLGLDPADAPAEHAERVDHRRVRVGADQRVREGDTVAHLDDLAQVLEVDLVDDAHPRRDDAEVLEGALRPAEQRVALGVALELAVDVALVGAVGAERVDLDGVVDHQVDGHQRVDLAGVAAAAGDGVAHRGQVDHGRDAGQVLHDHARGHEREVRVGRRIGPCGEGVDVGLGDVLAVHAAEQVLEQHAHRVGQRMRVDQAVDAMDHLAGREGVAHYSTRYQATGECRPRGGLCCH